MASMTSNTNRMALAGVALVLVAGGAYYFGRVYPPRDAPTSGTIAPADRYRSSQIQNSDVALGDNSVPMLMQTDAFELMIKNPSFRALASDPGFMALAQNPAPSPPWRTIRRPSPPWRTIRRPSRQWPISRR